MRPELNTDDDMREIGFWCGTTCAVCGQPINKPPAILLMVESMDFFLHKNCESGFTSEIVKQHIGDLVLIPHDAPPERN